MTFNSVKPSPLRLIVISDALSERQLQDAITLWSNGADAHTLAEMIIEPNIGEINERLGEPVEPLYLAFAIEYAFGVRRKERE